MDQKFKAKELDKKFRKSSVEDPKRKTLEQYKEHENIKWYNMEQNLEREKRKLEWKKLNILAKEQKAEERLQFVKFEE